MSKCPTLWKHSCKHINSDAMINKAYSDSVFFFSARSDTTMMDLCPLTDHQLILRDKSVNISTFLVLVGPFHFGRMDCRGSTFRDARKYRLHNDCL